MIKKLKYIYGPVPSWRLGSSLGIDLLSQEDKICNFDCIYCQLGKTEQHTTERKVFIPLKEVMEELKSIPLLNIDYMTLSGRGEPTLAKNLGEVIDAIKQISSIPVAVITNSGFISKPEVKEALSRADFVIAKFDAYSQRSLEKNNNPEKSIQFIDILRGIKEFREKYRGRLALQMMFTEKNKTGIREFIDFIKYISPDEIQINTPLRNCNVRPLTRNLISKIKETFIKECKGISFKSVYDDREIKNIKSLSDEETLKRRGKVIS